MIKEKCKCGKKRSVNVGDRIWDGEWGIIAKGSVTKINFVLKKILNSEYKIDNIYKDNVIYTGTQEQVKWVKDRLVEILIGKWYSTYDSNDADVVSISNLKVKVLHLINSKGFLYCGIPFI